MKNVDIVLFESSDGDVSLPVSIDKSHEEIWLNRNHIAELYGRDAKTIGKHVSKALREELDSIRDSVVAKFATTAEDGKTYQVAHYNLDVILSVGYRVKSQRGIEFRRWAGDILRQYVVQGRAENEKRLHQLGEIASTSGNRRLSPHRTQDKNPALRRRTQSRTNSRSFFYFV